MTEAHFEIHYQGDIPVVRVTGDVDLTNVHAFEAVLERVAQDNRRAVVVALDQATYMDSKGVRALLTAAERLGVMRQRLLVVAPSGTISRRILELAGASGIVPTLETLEEALETIPHS